VVRNILFFIKASAILLFNHLKYRYKVIHIHNAPDFLVFAGLIPKLLGARIILDIHDILPEFFCQKFNQKINTPFAKLLLFMEKLSVHFADHVIAANDLWREKIINRDKIPAEACTTILNYPLLPSFPKPPTKPEKHPFTIIYPGTISHHHGLDIAIKAMSSLKKEIPSLRLHVYSGSNNSEYFNELKNLIRNSELNKNVRFFDPVPIEKLLSICQNADLGLVPKREGIFSSEAFSTKIFDFMAAGIPVIASKTIIDQYYFDDSLIMFFEPQNPKDLARCLLELFNNPQTRKSLVDNANRLIRENNWEVKKEIYYRIVDQLVDQNNALTDSMTGF